MADERLVQSWTIDEVVEWVGSIGYGQYQGTFRGNYIDGWRLVNQITSNSQLISMSITDFEDHKTILAAIRGLRVACGLDSKFQVPAALLDNAALLRPEEAELARNLCLTAGQTHLFANWATLGEDDDAKLELMSQLMELDSQYPGGLVQYCSNAVTLLAASKAGENPLAGLSPSVPTGVSLAAGTEPFKTAEATGLMSVRDTGFVLVAGGLGERLGYGGIKVALPTETTTGKCYLALYIEFLLAMQERARELAGDDSVLLPLAIMTSDDTHAGTVDLLEQNGYFGMDPAAITLMKQNKVPAIADNAGRLALDPGNPYTLLTKPHGHGDVHSLLVQTGVLDRWIAAGKKWLFFFQDTNAFCFRTFLPALGASVLQDYDFSSICIPRMPKQAVGAICLLTNSATGAKVTLNVEYNQLDPLLRSTTQPDGDVADAETGLSPFPGNTNQLVVKLAPYAAALQSMGGAMPEFVNPKYTDASKETFKAPARLECMMQDFPKLLAPTAAVGFCMFAESFYSPVKNNPSDASKKVAAGLHGACPATGEADLYRYASELLKLEAPVLTRYPLPPADAPEPTTAASFAPEPQGEEGTAAPEAQPAPTEVPEQPEVPAEPCAVTASEPTTYLGVPVALGPAVVLAPSWAVTTEEAASKVSGGSVSARSTLVLEGRDIALENCTLDGALVVKAVPGAHVTLKDLTVSNAGWEFVPLPTDEQELASVPEAIRIRGYQLVRHEERVLNFLEPGAYLVTE